MNLTIIAIREAIAKHPKADWEAQDHFFLSLSDETLKHRLGVLEDQPRLGPDQSFPEPDIVQVVAEAKGLSTYQLQVGQASGARSSNADAKSKKSRAIVAHSNYVFSLDVRLRKAVEDHLLNVPEKVDWRNFQGKNCVTSVKDQNPCNSCVGYAAASTMESMLLYNLGLNIDLSEADIYYCGGGGNCDVGMYEVLPIVRTEKLTF